ncbi:MAG: mechanosensitive ion channel [Kiritimatiellae bacterium]|nr:mechanosensitive ion channel [Kiritimatiellia bacterium]
MSISHVMSRIAPYGPRILVFIAMCAGGWLAAHIVKSFVLRLVRRGKAEATVGTFLANLLYALALVLVLCAALDELGVQTASIVAMLGAAGLAIGLALQGRSRTSHRG